MNLNNAKDMNRYAKLCTKPWYQPGLTIIGSSCGVSGGNPLTLNGEPKPYCGGMCIDGVPCEDPKNDTLNNCLAGWNGGQGAEVSTYNR